MTTSFEEIADNYRAILFDAFGVLKDAHGVFDGVLDVMHRLQQQSKEIYVLTNDSSRSPARLAAAYEHAVHGLLVPPERLVASGLLARDFLARKVRRGWIAYLGTEESAHYISDAGLSPVPVSECREEHAPKALALLDDEGFDWTQDINRAINLVRHYHLPVIVANADLEYPKRGSDIAIAIGGIARLMEHILKKSFIVFGKPNPAMFSFAITELARLHPDLGKGDILMVGDTLETDIFGANATGIDTALVLSGNTLSEHAEVAVRASGIIPDFICDSILT